MSGQRGVISSCWWLAKRSIPAIVMAFFAGPGALLAHHSFAMFDMTKSVTISGAVKSVEYVSPHPWVYVTEKDSTTWSIEVAGIEEMKRLGWNRQTVKPGDKITITFHPMRDGKKGGSMMAMMLSDGKTFKFKTGGLPGYEKALGDAQREGAAASGRH